MIVIIGVAKVKYVETTMGKEPDSDAVAPVMARVVDGTPRNAFAGAGRWRLSRVAAMNRLV